jgi:hypothetical protein
MNSQAQILEEIIGALATTGVRYVIGGSVASSSIGIPRATLDTDVLVEMDRAQVGVLARELGGQWYLDAEFAGNALANRRAFNVIHMPSGFKFDLFPAYSPFHRAELQRAVTRRLKIDDAIVTCLVATAEDMILAKLSWYREGGEQSDRQWDDVVGMLATVKNPDWEHLHRWANDLGVQDLLQRASDEANEPC